LGSVDHVALSEIIQTNGNEALLTKWNEAIDPGVALLFSWPFSICDLDRI
jgi:hypothetical protein